MSPPLAHVTTKAALKSDVDSSALFITRLRVEAADCKGEPLDQVQQLFFHQ